MFFLSTETIKYVILSDLMSCPGGLPFLLLWRREEGGGRCERETVQWLCSTVSQYTDNSPVGTQSRQQQVHLHHHHQLTTNISAPGEAFSLSLSLSSV